MIAFWVFVWFVLAGIALFGEDLGCEEWPVWRKVAAFIAFGPIIAVGLFIGGLYLFG